MKKTESKAPIKRSPKGYNQKEKLLLTFYFFVAFLVLVVPQIISSIDTSIKVDVFTKCYESHHLTSCDNLSNESGVSYFWYMLGFMLGGVSIWVRWIMNWPYLLIASQKGNLILTRFY